MTRDRTTRLLAAGRPAFAAALVAVGVAGVAAHGFGPIWTPVPAGVPGRALLAVACAVVSLAGGAALVPRRTMRPAARVLAGWLLLWLVAFRLPVALRAPAAAVAWESCGETAAILAGAWILCARGGGRRAARGLFGLALVAFGVAHFAYVAATAALVPSWLPRPAAWVVATGAAYVAAGAALLADIAARRAAALATLQMGGFTLLVWVPAVLAGGGAEARSECVISLVLTAAAWVVAGSWSVEPAAPAGPASNPRPQEAQRVDVVASTTPAARRPPRPSARCRGAVRPRGRGRRRCPATAARGRACTRASAR